MTSYEIVFKSSVEKDFRSFPKILLSRVLKQIEKLSNDPFPINCVKLEGGEQLYRIRVGDYRIVYGVDRTAQRITVHYVRHRRDVYRKL